MKKTILLSCFSFLLITQLAHAQSAQLWGMTPTGGLNTLGVIFKINVGETNLDTVYSFNSPSGDLPQGDLFKAANNVFYGTNFYGGANLDGTIFSYNPSNNIYSDLHDFDSATGEQSNGSLVAANNGKLYGMTGAGGTHNFGVIFSFNPNTDTYVDVHDFDSTHGSNPYGNLLISSNGILYGMTQYGGAHNFGAIFSFDTLNNTFNDLHDFDSIGGCWPYGSLVQSGGKLFGLTSYGGVNDEGVLFSYNISASTFSKLYDFSFDSGGSPQGNLLQISNGIFYGTTYSGGKNSDGVIFSFDTLIAVYTDQFDFSGTNGQNPPASLTLASDGNLYGMTYQGGSDSDGVIFNFNPTNSNCAVEFNFNGIYGQDPNGNLVEVNATGIDQLATNNNQLLVYPNPASNQLTIISSSTGASIDRIEITNLMGQIIFKSPSGDLGVKKTIDVSSLSPGMYFVSVTLNHQTITNKISIIK